MRGPDARQIADVLGCADDRRNRPISLGRAAELDELHTIRRGGDLLEVPIDRFRGGELPVGAHPEAEVCFGSENW